MGIGAPGNTVRKLAAVVSVAVTLATTAVAPGARPSLPASCWLSVCPWCKVPPVSLVSSTRTGEIAVKRLAPLGVELPSLK